MYCCLHFSQRSASITDNMALKTLSVGLCWVQLHLCALTPACLSSPALIFLLTPSISVFFFLTYSCVLGDLSWCLYYSWRVSFTLQDTQW